MAFTGEQIRAARALLRWEQRDLAKASDVSVETIRRLERIVGSVSANSATLDAIEQAFRAAGVEFLPADNGGPGVRLRNEPT